MIILKASEALSQYLINKRNQGYKIGFVPTMGALHTGHISLLQTCQQQNDISVCSIFVNPTQFNNAEDFQHYPRRTEEDIQKLVAAGCDVLFLPAVNDIYPTDFDAPHYDLGYLEEILEGAYRPGHFQGVCQVVDRLLQIVQPHQIYLGQKDYQQCMVIRRMMQLTGKQHTHLNFLSTVREADGLAMSSRNLRLTADQRQTATVIFKTLQNIRQNFHQVPVAENIRQAKHQLVQHGFEVDYVEIADAATLRPIESADAQQSAIALIAATIGKVRLIDNMLLQSESGGDGFLQQTKMNS